MFLDKVASIWWKKINSMTSCQNHIMIAKLFYASTNCTTFLDFMLKIHLDFFVIDIKFWVFVKLLWNTVLCEKPLYTYIWLDLTHTAKANHSILLDVLWSHPLLLCTVCVCSILVMICRFHSKCTANVCLFYDHSSNEGQFCFCCFVFFSPDCVFLKSNQVLDLRKQKSNQSN